MHLTKTTDYAVRMVFYLALQGRLCSSREISEETAVSRHYITQISARLRRRGVIRSVAGLQGGYEMARPADQVTLFDLVDAIEGASEIGRALDHASCRASSRAANCPMRQAYGYAQAAVETALKNVTVGQMLDGEAMRPRRKEPFAQGPAACKELASHAAPAFCEAAPAREAPVP